MNDLWLTAGLVGGYLLLMWTNPIRPGFRDGIRAMRRYRALWVTLGACGFAYALFQLGIRIYFHQVLPAEVRPAFRWMHERGTLWNFPPGTMRTVATESILPALDQTAGIFNNLVSTFPLAAVASVLLMVNWQRHQLVLWRALRKRFGRWGVAVHCAILLCALAALVKPLIYVLPFVVDGALWYVWSPVVEWLAFIFEYLLGVGIQVYLILLAYCWVRGLTFTHQHLLDFAIRRFSYVMRWAAVVLLLSSLLLNLPLILKNFPAVTGWFYDDPAKAEAWVVNWWVPVARGILAAVLLLFATVQITLTFHSESLRRALREHVAFVRRHTWPMIWYSVIAAIHCYILHAIDGAIVRGVGEGTTLWVLWTLLFPWLTAIVGAWLLASWVIVYKRCRSGKLQSENWIQF